MTGLDQPRRCATCTHKQKGDRLRRGFGFWCRRHLMPVGLDDYCPDWDDWMHKSHPHCRGLACAKLFD